jgi:subtilisin family serine protease
VVGVAAGVEVIPVKVLNKRGSGSMGDVLCGVDFVGGVSNADDVANMSLGGGVYSTLDDAVVEASLAGARFVLAAGNEGTDANSSSPARANGSRVFTISAFDVNDVLASWSNYGNPPIDFSAPGVGIFSTYKNGGYRILSGTSMAAPHFAGLLLGGIVNTDGVVGGDTDGIADSIAVH